jgi:hypothetical protein
MVKEVMGARREASFLTVGSGGLFAPVAPNSEGPEVGDPLPLP